MSQVLYYSKAGEKSEELHLMNSWKEQPGCSVILRERGFAPSKLEPKTSSNTISRNTENTDKLHRKKSIFRVFFIFPGIVNQEFITSWNITGCKWLFWKEEQENICRTALSLRNCNVLLKTPDQWKCWSLSHADCKTDVTNEAGRGVEGESCLILPQRSHPFPQWHEITTTYLDPGYGGPRVSLGSAGDGNVLACLCHQVLGGMQEHGDHCATQGKKVTGVRNASRKTEKSVCKKKKTSQHGESRAAELLLLQGLCRGAAAHPVLSVSLPSSLFINLCNLCSLFSAPLCLSLGQLHRNVLHHLKSSIQRLSRKYAPAETGIMTCFRNYRMRLSWSISQARLSNYIDLAGLKIFCEFCAWSFTSFMLLESFLPSSLPLAKPCPICEQARKFAYLE